MICHHVADLQVWTAFATGAVEGIGLALGVLFVVGIVWLLRT